MVVPRLVVTVSELRRRLAALIDEVDQQEHPVFVTQYGVVTAVLISRREYESGRQERESRRCEPCDSGRASAVPAIASSRRSRRLTPEPTRRVWTQYGWCDFVVAQVLAEQGVETELVFTDEGWMTDDE
jgi:prevent-host-death family protein